MLSIYLLYIFYYFILNRLRYNICIYLTYIKYILINKPFNYCDISLRVHEVAKGKLWLPMRVLYG